MTGPTGSHEPDALTDEFLIHLRAQHQAAVEDAHVKQDEAATAVELVHTIENVLRSVEALRAMMELVSSGGPSSQAVLEAAAVSEKITQNWLLHGASVPRAVAQDAPPPPQLAPYVPAVGGKRLKSKMMIFDLFKNVIKEPVTRDQLRDRFFDCYGREDLERYWQRPENALNTAIDRAVADHFIEAVEVEGHETVYTIGWKDSETGRPAFSYGEDDE